MSTQLQKFDPSKSLYFRGFSDIDCPAAIHHASANGFTLSQVFRSAEDFSVLVIFDVDDYFNHPTFKPLPDGDLTGIVLEFDMAADQGVFATLDRPKYPSLDFQFLDYIAADGSAGRVDLSWNGIQYALVGGSSAFADLKQNPNPTAITAGSLGTASATVTLDVGSALAGDLLTLWWENYSYSYALLGGDNPTYVAGQIAAGINAYSYAGNLYGLSATSSGPSITITASRPGVDGNSIALYWTATNSSREHFTTANPIQLSGGSSAVTFHVKLDFSALGITSLRQAWLTFAPAVPAGQLLSATSGVQGDVVFSNWGITADPNSKKALKVAGPGSVRLEETDARVSLIGAWNQTSVGWFSNGFAVYSNAVGDHITVTYWCQFTHDLWLGTSLYSDRGKFGVMVDGAAKSDVDMMLVTYPHGSTVGTPSSGSPISAISTRRQIASAIAPGQHTLVLTVKAGDTPPSGISAHGFCYFDFLEAVVASDVPAAPGPWTDRGISTDFDTQHGYQLAPERLLWMMDQMGFKGDIDHYIGVFWWNNRQIVGRTLGFIKIDFSTIFSAIVPSSNTGIFIDLAGTTIGKSISNSVEKSAALWAMHFALYINEVFTGAYASVSGTVLTITARSPAAAYQFTFSAYYTNNGVTDVAIATTSDSIGFASSAIASGVWEIDPSQAAITYPIAQWHSDYFAQIAGRGMKVAAAFSMELVYPPDANTVGNVWIARSSNGVPISTATGFGSINSSQCAPMATSFLAYQKAVYLFVAGLMNAAGLTPYLQFGEFLWWFFSALWQVPIGYLAVLSYVRLGFADPHGLAVGDLVRVKNCVSVPSVNGTWTVVAVPDSTHIDISAPYGGGAWNGDGIVSGGSMAYYDAETAAAASSALGRNLARFTFPDDDPSGNSADATFLANRLAQHVAAIISYVQSTYSGAVFEVLWPGDVNGAAATPISNVGGRLNHFVNFPAIWQSAAAAPFGIFKLEQLAFTTTDRNLDLVDAGMAYIRGLAWPVSQLRYLKPVDAVGIPIWKEYRLAKRYQFPLINEFAVDQLCLLNLRLDPEPEAVQVLVS